MAKNRMNITLSEELKAWYVKESEKLGVSISSYMVMALARYREEREAMVYMGELKSLVDQMERLQNESLSNNIQEK